MVCALSTEILQKLKVVPGTFDFYDIFFYLYAFFLFIIINKIKFIKNKTIQNYILNYKKT